ncbi:MAG: acyl-CoA synthetase FdrA [Caldilineaceae bacterium]
MLKAEIRNGAYYDSVVLMQLQRALAALPGVLEAGVVMGTPANKDVLAQSNLLTPEIQAAAMDDLIIVISAPKEQVAADALAQVDALLTRRRQTDVDIAYRPKSLEAAVRMQPEAQWVLISVPGRYAADVAKEALRLGRNVFLYSDNVSVEDEAALKQTAAQAGLLVMGPDCGTAIVNGIGLGFANRVRKGPIGLIGASGTGLQQVAARIHQLGSGITHALGTGGRDLSEAINGQTAHQALDLLDRDLNTHLIVIISKPPTAHVAEALIRRAQRAVKPVIINFIGYQPAPAMLNNAGDNLHFVRTLDAAAQKAVELAAIFHADAQRSDSQHATTKQVDTLSQNVHSCSFAPTQKYLRALFSGGTLAYETLLILQEYLPAVYSNVPLDKRLRLAKATESQEHTVVDLGEDEFTVGRLHPMMDNALRITRLQQEAADPTTALILLDVVLGYGAHPDPASELAPAIAAARAMAAQAGRTLPVTAIVVGTDEDPQDLAHQVAQLEAAGATVAFSLEDSVRQVGETLQTLSPRSKRPAVDLAILEDPLTALNIGLEIFTDSLRSQGAAVVQVDWRPPAGGNERLAGILARMKSQ